MPVSKKRKTVPVAPDPAPSRRRLLLGIGALVAGGGLLGAVGYEAVTGRPVLGSSSVGAADLVDTSGLPETRKGDPDAPVEIVKFTSLVCPACAAFHNATLPEIERNYVERGLVSFVVRDVSFSVVAVAGAMLARCNPELYFPVVDVLYARQSEWAQSQFTLQALQRLGAQMGFSDAQVEACLSRTDLHAGLRAMQDQSERLGVTSTPTFFINGERLVGAQPFSVFREVIDRKLEEASAP